jgi:hypothetical protein
MRRLFVKLSFLKLLNIVYCSDINSFFLSNCTCNNLSTLERCNSLQKMKGTHRQCRGFGSASNKIQDPDPPQRDKLNPKPNLHHFADDKLKYMEYELI